MTNRTASLGRTTDSRRASRHQSGIALITAMMILTLVATLALAAMDTTTRDQQIASVQMRARVAFQAAEAGLSTALATMTSDATPTLTATSIGVSGDYPQGLPGFAPDPSAAAPVEYLGAQPVPGMSLNVNGSGPTFQLRVWRFHVMGSEPRGMTQRVEAAAAVFWGS